MTRRAFAADFYVLPPGLLAFVAPVVVAATLAAPSPARAEGVDVDTERSGDAIEIRASAPLKATREAAWRVLTDYARYAEFLPDMQTSKVVSRSGAEAVIEQRGEARFLWFRLPLHVKLAVLEVPFDWVESKLITGTLRDFQGRYELQKAGDAMRLVYKGRMTLDQEHRGIFDSVAVRHNVSRQFRALVREIERTTETPPAPGGA